MMMGDGCALGGPGLYIWGRLSSPPPWASDVVLNFPSYLIKMHIGLNRPNSYLGPFKPAAL
jgi:hypothetical protein